MNRDFEESANLHTLDSIPGALDDMPPSLRARDAEITGFVKASYELMQKRALANDDRFASLESGLAENTRQTTVIAQSVNTLADDTKQLIEVAKAAHGAIKVLNWIGSIAKPIGYILIVVGSVASAYATIKGLISPTDIQK